MTWRTLAAGGFALALLLGGGDPGEAQSKKRLAMGCAPSTVSHYPYCVGQARAINAGVPDVDVTVVETGASVDNLKRMQKNTIDYGLTTNEQVALAHKGDGVWKPTPFPEIRNLWYYSVSAVYVIVREDTGVKSIDELAGKKFAAGFRGSRPLRSPCRGRGPPAGSSGACGMPKDQLESGASSWARRLSFISSVAGPAHHEANPRAG